MASTYVTATKILTGSDAATVAAAAEAFIAATANIVVVDVQVNGMQVGIQGQILIAINYYIDAAGTNYINKIKIIYDTDVTALQTAVNNFIGSVSNVIDVLYNGVGNGISGRVLAAVLYKA